MKYEAEDKKILVLSLMMLVHPCTFVVGSDEYYALAQTEFGIRRHTVV